MHVRIADLLGFTLPGLLACSDMAGGPADDVTELSGAIQDCHDPSRIIFADKRYWVFSTGVNLNLRCSSDLIQWRWAPSPFASREGVPDWMVPYLERSGEALPTNLWAPDIIKVGDQYFLYYSRNCGTIPADDHTRADAVVHPEQSVCGSATSRSLTPPQWVDQGPVLSVQTHYSHYRVIDPAPFLDSDGRLWLVVGSYGSPNAGGFRDGGIRLFELDPHTGKLLHAHSSGRRLAGSWIEAAYLHKHCEHYYLLFNDGAGCRGKDSTYFIRVGRSRKIA